MKINRARRHLRRNPDFAADLRPVAMQTMPNGTGVGDDDVVALFKSTAVVAETGNAASSAEANDLSSPLRLPPLRYDRGRE